MVDEEEQYIHNAKVLHLHSTLYSKQFILPSLQSNNTTSSKAEQETIQSLTSSPGTTFSELASSEIGDISDIRRDSARLRDPSKLKTSQLTDATFRQYVLDYMTQETLCAIESITSQESVSSSDSAELSRQLYSLFPEFKSSAKTAHNRPYIADSPLEPFSITDILETQHLSHLGQLVVDQVTRQEEKRRRRRIRDGVPRPSDLRIETERKLSGRDWRLNDQERQNKILRLTTWVIRNLHEDGAIVHTQNGYLPLPASLLFPILIPFIEREGYLRKGTFMRKDDPRKSNGVMVDEILVRLNKWGEEGRWERVKGWVIQDAMDYAERNGLVKRRGMGWDLVESG